MDESVVPSLKLIFKPLIMYYGEWELLEGLEEISLEKNGKNLFHEFLERYYYMPLNVIFKDEDLVRSFKYSICSRLGNGERTLFFSKRAFLRNLIANADDIVETGGDEVFKSIKKALREKKDMYRDVVNEGEKSKYYREVKNEFIHSNLEISIEDYILLCKQKFTRLLYGYNAVLDLFDKPLNVDKFIKCFDIDQLYLFTCYSLVKHSTKHYEAYGKLDYNIMVIDNYKDLVKKLRKKDSFYNSHIIINNDIVYTIDDLFKDYDELVAKANEK